MMNFKKFATGFGAFILAFVSLMISDVAAINPTHSFDSFTGQLSVNYAGFLSKHDIVYKSVVTKPGEGTLFANGKVGAMIWNTEGGLVMQVSNVDNSPSGRMSSAKLSLVPSSGFNAGYTNFEQRLVMNDGLVITKYDDNRIITTFGDPNTGIMGIHVEDSRPGISGIDFNMGIWSDAITTADDTGISLSRADILGDSPASDNYGYAIAASVEGAKFTTERVSFRSLKIHIKPSKSYTIWIANTTNRLAPNHDAVAAAKALIVASKKSGYAKVLVNGKSWWNQFWGKFFVQYSTYDGAADYLNNLYYASNYYIAGGSMGEYPLHFNTGIYRCKGDSSKWENGWWYWNTRCLYNGVFSINHPELINPIVKLYNDNFQTFKIRTGLPRKANGFEIDGIRVAEMINYNSFGKDSGDYATGQGYTASIMTTGTEVAMQMYYKYKYTNDAEYLKNVAYPFMREVAKFWLGFVQYDGKNYFTDRSDAHESFWWVKNPATDLMAVRVLMPVVIDMAKKLNLDVGLVPKWQDLLNKMAPFSVVNNVYQEHATLPSPERMNWENVACEMIWPYNLKGLSSPDFATVKNTFLNRPIKPNNSIWSPDAVQAARVGLGDQVFAINKSLMAQKQIHESGLCDDGNGRLEANGLLMISTNEAMLQSYNDTIRVFAATPGDPTFIGRFTLLASGGFLVSSEKEEGEIKYIGIKSLYGNSATVINPWDGQQVQVRKPSDNSIVATTANSNISFKTKANAVYVIERIAKPLNSYSFMQITSSGNNNYKTFGKNILGQQ